MTPSHLEKLAREYCKALRVVTDYHIGIGEIAFGPNGEEITIESIFKSGAIQGHAQVLAEALPLLNDCYQLIGGLHPDVNKEHEEMLDRLMGFCERWDDERA